MVPFISYWYHDDTTPGIHMITKIKNPLDTLTLPAMQWALLENKNVTPALKRSTTSVISRCRSPTTFPSFFYFSLFKDCQRLQLFHHSFLPLLFKDCPVHPVHDNNRAMWRVAIAYGCVFTWKNYHPEIRITKTRCNCPLTISIDPLNSTNSQTEVCAVWQ